MPSPGDLIVAVCFPSCNPQRAATAAARWSAQGYRVCIAVEPGFGPMAHIAEVRHWLVQDAYPGYFQSCNKLARIAAEGGAEVMVAVGDDMDPDPRLTAQEIGRQFLEHFPGGFGIMQPIGDDLDGTDRICGSPWFGRGWLERAYGGRWPLWGEYRQFYGDEELLNVAKKLGVLWQRKDLVQYHHHWVGGREPMQGYQKANSDRWWKHDEEIFKRRIRAGFPGFEPRPPGGLV